MSCGSTWWLHLERWFDHTVPSVRLSLRVEWLTVRKSSAALVLMFAPAPQQAH